MKNYSLFIIHYSFKKLFKQFFKSESGQSLAFAGITFFALMIVGLMIFGVGEATTTQMEIQNAADAGAYSSAQVMADSVAQVAWLNEAMAYIYYNNMRHAVDNVTTAVHAELKEHSGYYGDAALFGGSSFTPSDDIVGLRSASGGIVNASNANNTAYTVAAAEISKGEEWLRILSRVQRGIAILTPRLVEHQAIQTALSNMKGVSEEEFEDGRTPQVAFWPRFEFVGVGPSRRICYIERLENGGWHFWSETDPFDFVINHLNIWDEAEGDAPDNIGWWEITKTQGENELYMEIKVEKELEPELYTSKITFEGHRNEEEFKYTILIDPPPDSTVHVIDDDEETSISTDNTQDPPVTTITQNGNSTQIRRNAAGYMEYYETSSSSWEPLGGTTTTVDGVDIPVDHNPHIEIGPDSSLYVGPPIRIHFPDINVTLREPIVLNFTSPFGWINVNDNYARIAALSTSNPSDQFRPVYYAYRSDGRIRHRLMENEPQVYNEATGTYDSGEWEYEWQRFGSYTADMSMRDFAVHSIIDHDPFYNSNSLGTARYFAPTYSTEDENAETDDTLWQTSPGTSRWRYFPKWARPQRTGAEAVASPAYGYGGWFDISAGKPFNNASYSQTRECWYCVDKGDVSGALYDYHDNPFDPSPTEHQTCIRPCGFWYEMFTDPRGTTFHRATAQARVDELNAAWNAAGLPGIASVNIPDTSTHTNANQTMIQVTCPVCARKYAWANEHNAEGRLPAAADIAELHTVPSIVRKYTAHAIGRHNAAVRAQAVFGRNINTSQGALLRDYFAVKSAAHGNTSLWQPPLKLTTEFFRKGITVATWRDSDELDFFSSIGGRNASAAERRRGTFNPVSETGWGHFGIATSRLVFWNYDNLDGEISGPFKHYSFEWDPDTTSEEGMRPDWITDAEDTIDPLGRPIHWQREMWLRSQNNLFEPDWGAILVSNRKALDVHDLYSVEDFDNGIVGTDNGTTYMLRHIRSAEWCREINDLYRIYEGWHPTGYWSTMSAPPMQNNGSRVDYEDPLMEEIMRH
ncbi:MAG: TadE/TadG family type IV pilus assembly protein [Planctomycetota bacterium]